MWYWKAPQVEETALVAPVALNPKKWITLPLIEREDLSHDARRYRFGLPLSGDGRAQQLGLPVGQHVYIKGMVDGKPVMRAYTPLGHGLGYVDFVVKTYFPSEPQFPKGGVLTMHMEKLKVGEDSLQFKGPLGEYTFDCDTAAKQGERTFSIDGKEKAAFKSIGLIAGGSGITPCLQVANALLAADLDVNVHLLSANKTPADVLCRPELDEIAKDRRVHLWYTVSKAGADDEWPFSTGRIDAEMLRAHMPPPAEDTFIFMCGPPGMIDLACKPNLRELGHADGHLHCF